MASIVYCGGCNPQIDRGAVARELEAMSGLRPATARVPDVPPDAAPAAPKTVLLSGCARACASAHQLVDETAGVIVAGELVDGVATPAGAIAGAIAAAIARRLTPGPDEE